MAEKAVPPKIRHRLASFLSFTGATANQVIKLVVYSTVQYSTVFIRDGVEGFVNSQALVQICRNKFP